MSAESQGLSTPTPRKDKVIYGNGLLYFGRSCSKALKLSTFRPANEPEIVLEAA